MSGLRFSIANLLATVALICVGVAALNNPSGATAGLMIFATMGALLAAVIGMVYRQGATRAFWLGVALFGGAYFTIVFTQAFAESKLREPLKVVRRAFWTTPLPASVVTLPEGKDSAYDKTAQAWLSWPAWDSGFGDTAHCLVAWLFALVGGMIGRWFYATAPRGGDKPQSQ